MTKPTIAIIGGTGDEGSGLAMRWGAAGYDVIIGSRQREKAERRADEMREAVGDRLAGSLRGLPNAEAAATGDIVVITVPYSAHQPTLAGIREHVQGKIIVDCTVPLQPPKVSHVYVPEGGSAAQEAQQVLGDGVTVVSAFQNVSATKLQVLDADVNCDVLVCSDDSDDAQVVVDLAKDAGMFALYAGPLKNSVVVEGLTSVLIGINIRNKVKGSGIRITNIPRTMQGNEDGE